MLKDTLVLLLVAFALGTVKAEPITVKECKPVEEQHKFIVSISNFLTEEEMRQLFPRHLHVLERIYTSDTPRVIPKKAFKLCMRDVPA